jgi:hypothetical protein
MGRFSIHRVPASGNGFVTGAMMSTMKKLMVNLLLFSLFPVAGITKETASKDNQRVYDAPLEQAWAACVQVANEKFTLIQSEKASGVLSFTTGTVTIMHSNSNVGVTVSAADKNRTKVVLNAQTKGTGFDMGGKGKLYKKFRGALDQQLKQ